MLKHLSPLTRLPWVNDIGGHGPRILRIVGLDWLPWSAGALSTHNCCNYLVEIGSKAGFQIAEISIHDRVFLKGLKTASLQDTPICELAGWLISYLIIF